MNPEYFDEYGNPVEGISEEQLLLNSSLHPSQVKSQQEKLGGMAVVLIGLACTVFVGIKIKRKVEEINKAAEEKEKEAAEKKE
jgi:hypothetical protein